MLHICYDRHPDSRRGTVLRNRPLRLCSLRGLPALRGPDAAAPRHASAGLRAWRTLGSDACVQRERIGPASGAPQTSAAAKGGNCLSWARTRVGTRFGLNAQRETFSDAVREGPRRSAFPAWRPRWVHRIAPFASSRREGHPAPFSLFPSPPSPSLPTAKVTTPFSLL